MKQLSVLLLTLGTFVTGTAELIVGGILKPIADDLNVSIALAGQLISAYSIAFAIGAPILIALTPRVERKKMLIGSLALFIVGCLASFWSTDYTMLMLSRLIVGLSAGVFTVVAFSSVVKLVPADQIGRAVGMVALGISCSMVLGIPIGIAITNWMGWQVIFAALALVTLIVMLLMIRLLPRIEGDAVVSFRQQFTVLRNPIIVFGMILSFFFSTSSSSMYSYVTPFMQSILHMKADAVGYMMLLLGLCSVIGSRLGGAWVDQWGTARIIYIGLAMMTITMALLPLLKASTLLGLILLCIWMLSMAISIPAIQTYFIQQAPESSNLVLSLNTSVLHLGVAAGAGIGGIVVDATSTVLHNPLIASGAVAISLGMAIVSIKGKRENAS